MRTSTRFRSILCALIVVSVVVAPSPASAHSASNAPSSNFHGRIVAIAPSTSRFQIEVIEATSRVELRWKSGPDLSITGYDEEPYLRVGPNGVFENQASRTTFLNRDRPGATVVPDGTGPNVAPVWKRINTAPIARWHDHRVHWMGTALPPNVACNKGRAQLVEAWAIPVRQGTTTHVVNGRLEWKPGPSSIPYLTVVLALAALGLLGGIASLRNLRRSGRASKVLAVALGVLIVIDATHLVAIASGVHGPGLVGRIISIGFVSIAAWVAGLIGAMLILQGRDDGLYLAVFAAFVMAIAGGFADLNILSSSATAASLPASTVRVLVTATLGLGLAVSAAGIALTMRSPRTRSSPSHPITESTP